MANVCRARQSHTTRKCDLKEALSSLIAKVKLLHNQWIDSKIILSLLKHYHFVSPDLNHTTFVTQVAFMKRHGVISTIESSLEPPNPSGWYHAKRRKPNQKYDAFYFSTKNTKSLPSIIPGCRDDWDSSVVTAIQPGWKQSIKPPSTPKKRKATSNILKRNTPELWHWSR